MIASIDNVGGGVKLEDINPNKDSIDNYCTIYFGVNTNGISTYIPIKGYKKIAFSASTLGTIYFSDASGNNIGSAISHGSYVWTDYIDIPNNATFLKIIGTSTGISWGTCYYSLLA